MANIEMNYYDGSVYQVLYPLGNFSNMTGNLTSTQIPNLDASKVTTGTFAVARIPNLDASKITSGILSVSRGGTGYSNLNSLKSALGVPTSYGNGGLKYASYAGTGSNTVSLYGYSSTVRFFMLKIGNSVNYISGINGSDVAVGMGSSYQSFTATWYSSYITISSAYANTSGTTYYYVVWNN